MRSTCPYCASPAQRPGPERTSFRYARCARCGSGYVASHTIDFRAFYEGYDPELVLDLAPVLAARYRDMLAMLAAAAPGRRMLEVGCGNGHFLALAAEAGWETSGTELSRAHAERARGRGLDVVYGDVVEETLFPGRRFDAVVAMEVIEHLAEPTRFLAVMAERLVPGGVVFLTTPNFGSVTRRLLGPAWSVLGEEHVALASPKGLTLALQGAGFRVVRIRSKSLYVGEYVRALRGAAGPSATPLAAENAALRDQIEESRVLTTLKGAVNAVLGATGLGEALECLARLARGGG